MDSELDYCLSTALSTPGSVVCWAMFLSMLVKANVPPVGGAVWLGAAPPWSSLQVDDVFFYLCLKYLPDLVKTRALQKTNVFFLPLHVF